MILNYNEIINSSNIDVKGVIHIGAFYGQEKQTYNNLNIKNVIWVEANPNYEEIIRNNVGDDIIIISGIGNTNEELTFNVANNGQSSSFLEFGTHLDEHPGINFSEKIKIPVKRMIDVVNEYNININDYNFLNVDIQGYELEAFKGFDNLLNNFDFIYCEVNEKELYVGCPLINEIDEYLNTFNFKRVLTNITGHGWGDAFYIKTNL
jgi:FkbM family methyltransferase